MITHTSDENVVRVVKDVVLPMSPIFNCPSLRTNRFEGFMSRCIYPTRNQRRSTACKRDAKKSEELGIQDIEFKEMYLYWIILQAREKFVA